MDELRALCVPGKHPTHCYPLPQPQLSFSVLEFRLMSLHLLGKHSSTGLQACPSLADFAPPFSKKLDWKEGPVFLFSGEEVSRSLSCAVSERPELWMRFGQRRA